MKINETENEFLKELHARIKQKRRADVLSAASYSSILKRMIQLKKKITTVKHKTDDSILKRYDLLEEKKDGKSVRHLCKKDTTLRVLSSDQIYKVLTEILSKNKNITREALRELVSSKYANITIEALQIFLKVQRPSKVPEPVESKLSLLAEICNNSRGYFTVKNLTGKNPNADAVYVLFYVDIASRFLHMRTLTAITSLNIAEKLLEFFQTMGSTVFLHSNYERAFTLRVIGHIFNKWPDCLSVVGKNSSNPNLYRCKKMIKEVFEMLVERFNDTMKNLDDILRTIQWQINNTLNSGKQ